MSISSTEEALSNLYQTEIRVAGPIATRVRQAFERLADAEIPLNARNIDNDRVTGGGGHSDPVYDVAQNHVDNGNDIHMQRRQLAHLIKTLSDANKGICKIIDEWASIKAPTRERPAENLSIWCQNHLGHGDMEPRENGKTLCSWCRDVKKRYGKVPSGELIEQRKRRGSLDDATYRRLLGRNPAA